jgi:uncharacterized protein (DUF362 family)
LRVRTPRLFIDSLTNGYSEPIRKGFAFLGAAGSVDPSDRVCIKPNLTYPVFRRGVMTSPEALEALIAYLKEFTNHITICESDSGGYNPFSMDEVFARTGLLSLAKRYGVRVVNLSHEPSRAIVCRTATRKLNVPVPTLLLDQTDLFITVPVPKMHLNTIVSIAIKNQWGVIQEPALRLKLHPYFKYVIHSVNRALPRSIAVVDGKYGLNRSGPMVGDAVELNWLIVSDNLFYCDLLVTDLMGLELHQIPYLRHILQQEGITSLDGAVLNTSPAPFRSARFYLRRLWTDYPGLMAFKSRFLAYLGYESVLAKPLHWLLYRFREPFY